jgi:pyrimidine oxygenase
MGLWPGDDYYSMRYEYAGEWLDVVNRLWASGRLTHHGRFFDLDDCISQPRPQRRPRPPVVCAGMSEAGLRFTVERCDYGFVGGGPFVFDLIARAAAIGDEVGCRARPIVLYTLVADVTDAAARERADLYRRGADVEAIDGYAGAAATDRGGTVSRHYEDFAFLTGTLIGSPDTVVAHLSELQSAGAYGVLFALPDPHADVDFLFEEIVPRMARAGLREDGSQ